MVSLYFFGLIGLTILQRVGELVIAKRNTASLLERGAKEFGKEHYVWIVALHTLFFLCMIAEFFYHGAEISSWSYLFLALFLMAQAGRFWVLRTMNGRWTTRVIALKGEERIARGPFRFLSHPNYTIVCIELFSLPMIFGLSYTAVTFTILNLLLLLLVRIPIENKALEWAEL